MRGSQVQSQHFLSVANSTKWLPTPFYSHGPDRIYLTPPGGWGGGGVACLLAGVVSTPDRAHGGVCVLQYLLGDAAAIPGLDTLCGTASDAYQNQKPVFCTSPRTLQLSSITHHAWNTVRVRPRRPLAFSIGTRSRDP